MAVLNVSREYDSSTFYRRFTGTENVDLQLAAPTPPTTANGQITYNLRVTNSHSVIANPPNNRTIGSATGIGLTATLPAGVTFKSASGQNWTCKRKKATRAKPETVTCGYSAVLYPNTNPLLASSSLQISTNTSTNGCKRTAFALTATQYDAGSELLNSNNKLTVASGC